MPIPRAVVYPRNQLFFKEFGLVGGSHQRQMNGPLAKSSHQETNVVTVLD